MMCFRPLVAPRYPHGPLQVCLKTSGPEFLNCDSIVPRSSPPPSTSCSCVAFMNPSESSFAETLISVMCSDS